MIVELVGVMSFSVRFHPSAVRCAQTGDKAIVDGIPKFVSQLVQLGKHARLQQNRCFFKKAWRPAVPLGLGPSLLPTPINYQSAVLRVG